MIAQTKVITKKAIGKNIKGEVVEFEMTSNGWISCSNNQLTELILPDGCKVVFCSNNQLTELILPEGCESVSCESNLIKELHIPNSVKVLWCDDGVILTGDMNPEIKIDLFIK